MHLVQDGYCIAEGIISTGECDELINVLQGAVLAKGKAGIRNLMTNGSVRSLALDPRLVGLTECFHGVPLVPYKATLFNKTSKANWLVAWHQDTALPVDRFDCAGGWSAPSYKAGQLFAHAPASVLQTIVALRIHLDESTARNGPLRVIPRSHLQGVLSDAEIAKLIKTSEPRVCLVGGGGVIAMSPLLLHASSKLMIDRPRRVLHIEYAESLRPTPRVRLAIS